MSFNKIPKSVKEIIDVFIHYSFKPLTYKIISGVLKRDTNTIVQRVKRNENYFDISGKRPYNITLKKNIKEIYLYRDKNQCQICRETFNPEKLLLRFKDPHMKEKYNWNNCFTCCQACKDKEVIKKTKKKRTPNKKVQKKDAWQYKEVYIKKIVQSPYHPFLNNLALNNLKVGYGSWDRPYEENLSPPNVVVYDYYEFDELNGKGWFHLTNDENDISSKSISDILNYFGDDEWELVSIKLVSSSKPTILSYVQSYEAHQGELYQCIFKRKKKGD